MEVVKEGLVPGWHPRLLHTLGLEEVAATEKDQPLVLDEETAMAMEVRMGMRMAAAQGTTMAVLGSGEPSDLT